MPPVYLFEDSQVDRLYPLTCSRAPFELRAGAVTLLERLLKNLGTRIDGVLVRSSLAETLRQRLAANPQTAGISVNPPTSTSDGLILINARWLLLKSAGPWQIPEPDAAGLSQNSIVWMHLSPELAKWVDLSKIQDPKTLEHVLPEVRRASSDATLIQRPWDLLTHQSAAIAEDFAAAGGHANHATFVAGPGGAHLINPEKIHLAPGVKIWPGAVLDAQNGPILIGPDTEIRACAVITGPVAIGAHCVIRNHADIREETTFGPGCRVGGEIIGSIFQANSNKQHHGFVGQSILGEWVNLGAGTTTSNVKNTYGKVKIPINGLEEPTGRQFMGSIIGDHVKLGIGTYLSTGSVVGFASHVIVPKPPRFVPSFAWVTGSGIARANFEKLEAIAATVMARRGATFTPADHALWVQIASEYALAEKYNWQD